MNIPNPTVEDFRRLNFDDKDQDDFLQAVNSVPIGKSKNPALREIRAKKELFINLSHNVEKMESVRNAMMVAAENNLVQYTNAMDVFKALNCQKTD